jgi:hypothetical protein
VQFTNDNGLAGVAIPYNGPLPAGAVVAAPAGSTHSEFSYGTVGGVNYGVKLSDPGQGPAQGSMQGQGPIVSGGNVNYPGPAIPVATASGGSQTPQPHPLPAPDEGTGGRPAAPFVGPPEPPETEQGVQAIDPAVAIAGIALTIGGAETLAAPGLAIGSALAVAGSQNSAGPILSTLAGEGLKQALGTIPLPPTVPGNLLKLGGETAIDGAVDAIGQPSGPPGPPKFRPGSY